MQGRARLRVVRPRWSTEPECQVWLSDQLSGEPTPESARWYVGHMVWLTYKKLGRFIPDGEWSGMGLPVIDVWLEDGRLVGSCFNNRRLDLESAQPGWAEPQVFNLRQAWGRTFLVARVDRATKWGNPFRIGPGCSRAEAISRYERWLMAQPELVRAAKRELRGLDLGCWCSPAPCHGQVLLAVANYD